MGMGFGSYTSSTTYEHGWRWVWAYMTGWMDMGTIEACLTNNGIPPSSLFDPLCAVSYMMFSVMSSEMRHDLQPSVVLAICKP